MKVRTEHKGYGVHNVFADNVCIGITFKNINATAWTGKTSYKGVSVDFTGTKSIRETSDTMAEIYFLLSNR